MTAHNPQARRVRGQVGPMSVRWYADCVCGWRMDARSREDAYALALDHEDVYGEDPPITADCACFVEHAGRLEYEPTDCPLHKEPQL